MVAFLNGVQTNGIQFRMQIMQGLFVPRLIHIGPLASDEKIKM
jgi:hypothetical protein